MLQTRSSRQADRRRGVPHRLPAARPGAHRRGRGRPPRHRRPARAADVPRFASKVDGVQKLTKGMNASPGAAVGKAVFTSERAVELAERGGRDPRPPRDQPRRPHAAGMVAAKGVLTSRGGKTSHAAVVARGMGKTCVCGAEELDVDVKNGHFTAPGGVTVNEGDVISIDGSSGDVYLGEVPVEDSPVVQYFEGELSPDGDDLVKAVDRVMKHADARRAAGPRELRQPGGLRARPPLRRRRHRPVPHRAHVPRRPPKSSSRSSSSPRTTRSGRRRWTPWSRCRRATSRASSRPWTGCPSRSGSSTRRCTSSCPTSPSCRCGWRSRATARMPRTAGCWRRSTGCTSRTLCSDCAACGSVW